MFIKKIVIILISCLFAHAVLADTTFIVRKVQYQGLQNISYAAMGSYYKSPVGKKFNLNDSSKIIQSLYKTGFFSNIEVSHRGSTLIIRVTERPSIGSLKITGNDSIESKKLRPVLTKIKLSVGESYHPAILQEFVASLKQQYISMGHYAVKIKSSALPLPRNRVGVVVAITEGPVAKIHQLKIVGAKNFSRRELLKNFKLTSSGLFSFITHNNRYSRMQLNQDLQNMQSFFLNHGYLDYKVVSQKIDISPDHKKVDIIIKISEGPVFRIGGFTVDSSVDKKQVASLVSLQAGDVFSRKEIVKINKKIANHFAEKGYAFPNVQVGTNLDRKKHLISLVFHITEGKRIYVRHVNITGNLQNSDLFLRSQLQQMEGSVYSLDKVNKSLHKLRLLPYIDPRKLAVNPVPVNGAPNQVDLNYKVTEVPAGRATVNAGYSSIEGFLYGANIYMPSFVGTGRQVSVGFSRSTYQQNYTVSYFNPVFTVNNIGQGFSIAYNKTTPFEANELNLANYSEGNFSVSNYYTLPISDFNQIQLGAKFERIDIRYGSGNKKTISPTITGLLDNHPSPYNDLVLTGGWSYNSLNRIIFPTQGNLQSADFNFGIPADGIDSLGYYTVTYKSDWYVPLGYGFIFKPHTDLGYGNGVGSLTALPFFQNFYGGGIGSLPGYQPYSLGPQFTPKSGSLQSLGGNLELFAGIDMIFPNYISDSLRTAVIINAGNIYDTHLKNGAGITQSDAISWRSVRLAAGVKVTWKIPMLGPVTVTWAYPLIHHAGDQLNAFGFTFGTSV